MNDSGKKMVGSKSRASWKPGIYPEGIQSAPLIGQMKYIATQRTSVIEPAMHAAHLKLQACRSNQII